MLTHEGCLIRRDRLWSVVPESVDWLLVADPRHVNYLCGFWVHPLSFSQGERGLLLLERNGPTTLFADNFARRSATHDPFVDEEIVESWYDHQHSVINRDHALINAFRNSAGSLSGRSGMVESESLPVALSALIDSDAACEADLGNVLRGLRRSKQQDEIDLLRLCMRAGDAGHARAREVVKPGISELDVYREIQSAAVAAAGRPALVYGDFRATNAETFKAGGLPTDYILRDGDLFIADFSVVIDGYRSDFTNTIAVGSPTASQTQMSAACVAAVAAGEEMLSPGTSGQNVFAAVSGALREAGFDGLKHHAGHGIGLAHPEPPIFVPQSPDVLVAGDVVTLEPGLYIEGAGGMRFEHNYLITETGAERLSNHALGLD